MAEVYETSNRILKLHIQLLKFLLIWPLNASSKRQNTYLKYGFFYIGLCCSLPVFSAAIYQFCVGIDNFKILLEALIGIGDITGYNVAYVCFIKKQETIQKLINDFGEFARYSGEEVIRKTEEKCNRYTRYLLSYVSVGLILNFIWQMLSTKSCIEGRGVEFYIKHDPCWMPVRNLYPFDANQPKYFWIVFPIETIYASHICLFFPLATATIIGFFIHISAQLRCCASKFEIIFDDVEENELSHSEKKREFIVLIKYHQTILKYSDRVFRVFDSLIFVYLGLTSLLIAVIGYQILNPKINTTDRIKYFMLLFAWCLLVYLICYYGQVVKDESLKVGQSIFQSKWHRNRVSVKMRKYLQFTLARTQKPLEFKKRFLGSISLLQFMKVLKWAYSALTLLLTVTDDE